MIVLIRAMSYKRGANVSVIAKTPLPAKLKLNKKLQPCAAEPDDELYPNGSFLFNISRLLTFINAYPERFTVEPIEVAEFLQFGPTQFRELGTT